jgi:Calcium binding
VAAVPIPDLIVRQFRSMWAAARLPRGGDRMKRRSRDEEQEQRITMEIIVDAYTPEEQAMGWYYSLEDR